MCSFMMFDKHPDIYRMVEVMENKPNNTFSAVGEISDAVSDF